MISKQMNMNRSLFEMISRTRTQNRDLRKDDDPHETASKLEV